MIHVMNGHKLATKAIANTRRDRMIRNGAEAENIYPEPEPLIPLASKLILIVLGLVGVVHGIDCWVKALEVAQALN